MFDPDDVIYKFYEVFYGNAVRLKKCRCFFGLNTSEGTVSVKRGWNRSLACQLENESVSSLSLQ